jgi:hypothetical protein
VTLLLDSLHVICFCDLLLLLMMTMTMTMMLLNQAARSQKAAGEGVVCQLVQSSDALKQQQ